MGSRQKAVDDFIAVCEDATMLDRWIPDEDWVRKIRVGKADLRCLIANLNMGLSKQCGFKTIMPFYKVVQFFTTRGRSNCRILKYQTLAFTKFCHLVCKLPPSLVTKSSTSHFGMPHLGKTEPSSESPIGNSTTNQEGQGIIN